MTGNKTLLNLGSGKVGIDDFSDDYSLVVHLDAGYPGGEEGDIGDLFQLHGRYLRDEISYHQEVFVTADIFDFMYAYPYKFHHINADRIFEHMFYDSGQIGQLLDACNQITHDDGTMTIIVPDAEKLSKLVLNIESGMYCQNAIDMNSKVLLVNSEFQNTRSDPHGSTWTPIMAHHYIDSEGGTWHIDAIERDVSLKGRDIYMKIKCIKTAVTP